MFEKQKADENERAAKRMMEKPQGRRHDALTDYHQRIQMGDDVHGFDAEAVSPSLSLHAINVRTCRFYILVTQKSRHTHLLHLPDTVISRTRLLCHRLQLL